MLNIFSFNRFTMRLKQFRFRIKSTACRGCWTLHMNFSILFSDEMSIYGRIYLEKKIHLKMHANKYFSSHELNFFFEPKSDGFIAQRVFLPLPNGIWENDIV